MKYFCQSDGSCVIIMMLVLMRNYYVKFEVDQSSNNKNKVLQHKNCDHQSGHGHRRKGEPYTLYSQAKK